MSTPTEAKTSASGRSLHGLDALHLLMADVRDGVGPYLSVFLKSDQHWQSGLLVDCTHAKRLLVAASGLFVASGCLLIAFFPKLSQVVSGYIVQVFGYAAGFLSLAAIALAALAFFAAFMPETGNPTRGDDDLHAPQEHTAERA